MKVAILLLIAMMTIAHCEVVELTDSDFDSFLKENPRTLVMFSASWCGHCKKMYKTLKRLANKVSESKEEEAKIQIVRIDADKYSKIGNRKEYKISGFPTFKYFDNSDIRSFTASHLDAMIEQLEYLRLPIFRVFENEKQFEESKGEKKMWALFRGSKDSTLFREFERVADKRRTGSATFSTILGEGQASLTLYRSFGEPSMEFGGEAKELKYFLDMNSVPEVCEFSRETKGWGPKVDVPRLVISCEDEDEKAEAKGLLESVSGQFKGVLQLTYTSDKKMINQLRKNTGLDMRGIILKMGKRDDTIYKIDSPLNTENLARQLQMFKEGTLPRYFKSQPEMEESKQIPFRHVVYDTFHQDVTAASKDKDVIVMYHAKWCGACKQLKPVMAELAQEAVEKMPKVLFVKYDSEENHAQMNVDGYPTVVMYQNGKAKKMKYFTRKSFLKFYEEHGSFEWKEFDKEKKQRLARKEKEALKAAAQADSKIEL